MNDAGDPPPREIVFTRYEGRRGTAWLKDAYALFRARRLAWFLLIFSYYALLQLVELVPLVGGIAAPLLKPVLDVGLLAAAWTQERGGAPEARLLFQGFKANRWALAALGVFFVLGIMLALAALAAVDGGKLFDMLSNPAPAGMTQEALAARIQATFGDAQVQLGMGVAVLCAIPTVLALWWAPALIVFQDATVVTALAMSLRAALANWRPLLRYTLALAFWFFLVPPVVLAVITAIVPPPLAQILFVGLVVPYWFGLFAVVHIANYVSYRDVFHSGETAAGEAPPAAAAD